MQGKKFVLKEERDLCILEKIQVHCCLCHALSQRAWRQEVELAGKRICTVRTVCCDENCVLRFCALLRPSRVMTSYILLRCIRLPGFIYK